MLSKFAKIALTATSIAPVFITLWFVKFSNNWYWGDGIEYLIITMFLTLICWGLLSLSRKRLQKLPLVINSVKTADNEMIGFIVAYLLPLINKSSLDVDIRVLIFVIFLLFLVIITSNSYHFNPLIGLLGYHFYEVTLSSGVSFVLLSQRNIRDCKSIQYVVHLSEYMIMEV